MADALADRIVLVFQRAVNAAVGWIHRQAAQMARHAVHAAYQIAFEVHLQQFGREGEIDVAAFEIDGNALHVERTLFARADFARQVTQIGTVFRPVGARRAGRQQQRNDQQRKQTFEVHRKFFYVSIGFICFSATNINKSNQKHNRKHNKRKNPPPDRAEDFHIQTFATNSSRAARSTASGSENCGRRVSRSSRSGSGTRDPVTDSMTSPNLAGCAVER